MLSFQTEETEIFISGFPLFRNSNFVDCQKANILLFLAYQRRVALIAARALMTTTSTTEVAKGELAEGENKSLNFKVSSDFKKQFKGFAVAQGITMTELLKEGFALSRKLRQK